MVGTDSFEDAVSGADVVCACTHADSPVLMGRWLNPGAHVNSVGLNFQGREMDDETVRLSKGVRGVSRSRPRPKSRGRQRPDLAHQRRGYRRGSRTCGNWRVGFGRASGPHLRHADYPLQVRGRSGPRRRSRPDGFCGGCTKRAWAWRSPCRRARFRSSNQVIELVHSQRHKAETAYLLVVYRSIFGYGYACRHALLPRTDARGLLKQA